jgi:hypothetical protein
MLVNMPHKCLSTLKEMVEAQANLKSFLFKIPPPSVNRYAAPKLGIWSDSTQPSRLDTPSASWLDIKDIIEKNT